MRFYIVLLAFSMCAWVALAAAPGVSNAHMNHIGGQSAKVQTVDDAGAATTDDAAADDDAAPEAAGDTATEPSATAEPPISEAIANGGQPLPAPAGPRTAAEEKADSVLTCMEGCGTQVACQNSCISTGYNIPSGPIPSATASIPPPLGATVTSTVAASTAPAGATTAVNTPKGSGGAAAQSGFGYRMGGAVAAVVVASFFVAL